MVTPDGSWAGHVLNAVKAKELFKSGVDYAVSSDPSLPPSISIVDPFSGRTLLGRKYADGLHQAIEAKEKIAVSSRSSVVAKISFQSFFRLFPNLAAMTGTAATSAGEFQRVYNLEVSTVPTALPLARRDYPDVIFKTRAAADDALVKEVLSVSPRPCLVGTTSVAQSERIVAALAAGGVDAELLNAERKNAVRESEIVAQAGRLGSVTVATNMAGRGTDIKLGGDASAMTLIYSRQVLVESGAVSGEEALLLPPPPSAGADYFPVTPDKAELAEAARLMKDSLGSTLTASALENLLVVATDTTESPTDAPHLVSLRAAVENVKAAFSAVTDEEKQEVIRGGGLYIMGTNRHESPRIDNQLRGRAGRQGDPGSSRYFLSFEDDMFTVFGADKFEGMLKFFRVSDDMPIESKQVAETLDKVQKVVEENNEDIRSNILKFDEILNLQRLLMYKTRNKILEGTGDELRQIFLEDCKATMEDIVKGQKDSPGKLAGLVVQFVPELSTAIDEGIVKAMMPGGEGGKEDAGVAEVTELLNFAVEEALNIKVKAKGDGFAEFLRYILLVTFDSSFASHLQNMEQLVEAVTLKGYRGLDPELEYQSDGFALFEGLQDTVRRNSVFSVFNNK